LYGANGSVVVKSVDHGATWTNVVTLSNTVTDIACDWQNSRLYIAAGSSLLVYNLVSGGSVQNITSRLGADNHGNKSLTTVAVDPVNTNVVYVGWAGNSYISTQAVRRSVDGGNTWTPLTLQPGDTGLEGGLECYCVRVNPLDRFLYTAGSCFGVWRYPPPGYMLVTPTPTNLNGYTSTPTPPVSELIPVAVPIPYPNPASQTASVQVQLTFGVAATSGQLDVFTLSSRKVNEIDLGNVSPGTITVTLPLSDRKKNNLANGLYFLVARSSAGQGIGKLLILR
jgi:hypothetical protein